MEAKLIKTYTGNFVLQTNEGIISGTLEPTKFKYKLSLKNCQAVENGYDLEYLVKHYVYCKYWGTSRIEQAYADGFNQALEILGDKKFSEDDVKKRVELVKEQFRKDVDAYGKPKKIMSTLDTIHQSLQQTEWDVEIVMEKIQSRLYIEPHKEEEYKSKPIELQHPYTTNPDEIWEYKPKFDSEGCLILKRKL